MDQSIEAVFENGVFRPLEKPDLSDGQHVRIVVLAPSEKTGEDPLLKLSGSVGGDFPDVGVEHDACDRAVGFPAVADLARQIGCVTALAPVPFVGLEAGLEFAAEQRREAGGRARHGIGIDQPLDDEEAVVVKLGDLGIAELDHVAAFIS